MLPAVQTAALPSFVLGSNPDDPLDVGSARPATIGPLVETPAAPQTTVEAAKVKTEVKVKEEPNDDNSGRNVVPTPGRAGQPGREAPGSNSQPGREAPGSSSQPIKREYVSPPRDYNSPSPDRQNRVRHDINNDIPFPAPPSKVQITGSYYPEACQTVGQPKDKHDCTCNTPHEKDIQRCLRPIQQAQVPHISQNVHGKHDERT